MLWCVGRITVYMFDWGPTDIGYIIGVSPVLGIGFRFVAHIMQRSTSCAFPPTRQLRTPTNGYGYKDERSSFVC